ncbi:MAG TPA: serine/threonine-protein kinase, partial [Polyangiaceae bacterium]|nr:serine/threonine-protein kinase [Polyangiaceae bacterium]
MSEAEATAAPGGRVVGRYVLYDEIAAGGMATVHIGRLVGAVGFSRSVAIKRLHAQFAHDPEFVNMFLEEARLTSRIRHANVVPVLDVESTQSELFLVMEFIQGETLSRLTRVDKKRSRVVPLPIALAIACDLLNGLHAAHEATDERGQPMQIVHRDVSPHNVMVGSDGISRVVDFGIAKAASSSQSTRDGEVKGKFAYMSPEQLSSVAVDRRADIFAAAIVLWEMLTGRRLFSANDPAGIVGKVLTGQIQPPSARIGGLPPALDALVMKALERDRGRRFATAADMARALENVGVPLARRSEVATWVKRIAGDTLKRRAKRLAAIETTGSFPGGAAAMAVPLSGPVLPEGTTTGSESGFRPIRGTEDPDASQTQAPITDDDERPRRSWPKLVAVAALAMAVGAGGFFVWRAGGWQPARAKVSRWVDGITNPAWKVTEMRAAAAAASAGPSAAQASASASAPAEEDDLTYGLNSDGKPTKAQARPGGRPRIHRPPP